MAASTMRFGRWMSDAEALMWYLEKDPALRASFANLTVFDRPPDLDRFRRRMERAAVLVPRLRQRVVTPPVRLAPPEWVDDPDFDIDFHIRRIAVPKPGSDRQVAELAALLGEDPFDRARPLWQFVVVEGLEGGRAAMIQKLHHTITDGEGGVRLSAMFVDLERDGDEAALADALGPDPDEPESTTPMQVLRDTVGHRARRQLDATRRSVAAAARTAAHPTRVPHIATTAADAAGSVLRQLLVTERARSPLWSERSLGRRLEVLSVPLDDAKRAAKNLGGTVNDFFVTGAAAAAGAYHRAKGAEVDELRMAMPVSTRTDRSAGGNAFSPTRVLVPTGALDPEERFEAVRERLASTKAERSVNLTEQLSGALAVLPTSVLVRFARQQVETVDFATSNVRGAPVDLYIAGARIVANYPLGPTGGTAFNLTTLSYRGSLDMGAHIDTAAVDDPDLLRMCLEDAYAELIDAGR